MHRLHMLVQPEWAQRTSQATHGGVHRVGLGLGRNVHRQAQRLGTKHMPSLCCEGPEQLEELRRQHQ